MNDIGRCVVPLDKPVITIGRRDGHDLQMAGDEVSRDHAEIVSTAEGFVIRDRDPGTARSSTASESPSGGWHTAIGSSAAEAVRP